MGSGGKDSNRFKKTYKGSLAYEVEEIFWENWDKHSACSWLKIDGKQCKADFYRIQVQGATATLTLEGEVYYS